MQFSWANGACVLCRTTVSPVQAVRAMRSSERARGFAWLPVALSTGAGVVALLTLEGSAYAYSAVTNRTGNRPSAASAAGQVAPAAGSNSSAAGATATAGGGQNGQGAQGAVRIELYGATWCPACRAAKRWLDEHHIAYVDYDVDRDQSAGTRLRTISPRGSKAQLR